MMSLSDLEMKTIDVNLGQASYQILIKNNLLDQVGVIIKDLFQGNKVFIITDQHVNNFYGDWCERALYEAGYQTKRLILPAGEASKSFAMLGQVYEALLDFKMTRQDLILNLGGGVVGDLGGFAAATYLRGIAYIQMPTSLLAQVDSSVGGKVAIDLPKGKNLVGNFYQPKAVLIDPHFLQTLPERYYRDGMAEVIKYACIKDANLFNKLSKLKNYAAVLEKMPEIIYICCNTKRNLVELDEKDQGERILLNFGHTLAHAIENIENYSGHSHGEAVSIGMNTITKLSEEMGLTRPGTSLALQEILEHYKLPVKLAATKKAELIKAIGFDKKNFGESLKVVLLKTIGESYIYQTNVGFFEEMS